MDKPQLLALMKRHRARSAATDYIWRNTSNDASVIGATCYNVGWLIWLLGRERRLGRFVKVCARRAKKFAPGSRYAADAAAYATAYAAYVAAAYANADAAAAYAAAAYADAAAAADAAADGAYAAARKEALADCADLVRQVITVEDVKNAIG